MTREQHRELGASTLNAVKKPCIAFQVVLCILGSRSMDSTNWGLCVTVTFTIERNPLVSGLCKLKPVLFKGQLYGWSKTTASKGALNTSVGQCIPVQSQKDIIS